MLYSLMKPPDLIIPMPDEEKERITADPFWKPERDYVPTYRARSIGPPTIQETQGASAKSDNGAGRKAFPLTYRSQE